MKWHKLRPYIMELVTFVSLVAGFVIYFTLVDTVIIRWSTAFILLSILAAIWFIQYVFSFVSFSVLALLDLLCKSYVETNATFIEQFIFRSSSFLDKTANIEKLPSCRADRIHYYKIVVKFQNSTQILTSAEYFELKPNVRYKFEYGRRSKALIDIKEL